MNMVLEENSVGHILLSNWAPALITILLGGMFASVIFPRWQYAYSRARAREERKHILAEELSRSMRRYANCWNRLRSIAELEAARQGGLTEDEAARKRQFVEARNAARDTLLDTLCGIDIYFSGDVRRAVDNFIAWDEACSVARLHELPSREDYTLQRQKLLQVVHREILK